MEGGVLYDRGSYGCIYVPPLKCQENTKEFIQSSNSRKLLDKIMDSQSAEMEFRISSRVRELPLAPNYFILAEHICTPSPRQEQHEKGFGDCSLLDNKRITSMKILRMPYGGKPIFEKEYDLSTLSIAEMLQHLLEGVSLLNLHGIIHNDLHGGNILMDSNNVPRIIDFNKAIFSYETFNQNDLTFIYSASYDQISPDYNLINSRVQGYSEEFVIRDFLTKRSKTLLLPLKSFFGITEEDVREGLEEFIQKSKSYREGDIQGWFKYHWRTLDSWSLAVIVLAMIYTFSFIPSFDKGLWRQEKERVMQVLKKMLVINPFDRFDCVQALNMLDASSGNPGENTILNRYGKEWLAALRT